MGNEKERDGIGTRPDPESTLSRKRSQKEFEELLLKDVLIELEAGDGEYWEQKAIELAGEPGYTPTAEQRAAFEERLDLEVKRIQKQEQQISQDTHAAQTAEPIQIEPHPHPKTRRILRRVASIAAVLVLFVFMTMYHTVEAFAAGVDRFITTVVKDEGAEELRIEEKEDKGIEMDIADFAGMYIPDWVPRGYRLDIVETAVNYRRILYVKNSGEDVCFEISTGIYSVLVDDEEVVEDRIYLHDSQGRVILTEEAICIVWEDGEYLYTISGKADMKDELVRMAEECIKVEK